MKKRIVFAIALLVAAALVVALFAGLSAMPAPVEAQSWPTPSPPFGGGDWAMVNYFNSTLITETHNGTRVCSNGQQTAAYVLADLQTVISVGATTTNALTCTLDYSNDNTNWCIEVFTPTNGIRAADYITCGQFTLFGRYSRVCCYPQSATGEGTNDHITLTIKAKVFN